LVNDRLPSTPLNTQLATNDYQLSSTMTIQNLSAQTSFITKDGSTIRSVLDRTNARVQNQSLAEARVAAGGRTERHYHKFTEELYFILEGAGEIKLDGEHR
jgi:mannose-6-phosphate isomerase-like protein (cupin superfamily)